MTTPKSTPVVLPTAGRVLWYAFAIAIGTLIWMLGLATLGVPADLPIWRHALGAALLALAIACWRFA